MEDMILPDDFETTAEPQAEDIDTSTTETEAVENTNDTEAVQEQTEIPVEQPKIKVKYNHEERELTLDEARELAQKGMDYDKKVERLKALETDPRLSFVEAQAKKYNMTPSDYIEAVKEQERQEELNQLIQDNVPEEYAKEMLENRRFREQFQASEKQKMEQTKQQAEYSEFFENYPDVKPEEIAKEVWDYKDKTGKSLTDAMMWHENQELKKQVKILKQNKTNKQKALVSGVTTHGSTETAQEDPFLSGFNSI